MAVNKEKWIDLFCLIQTVYHKDGMAHFIYDTDVPHLVHNQTYLLRKAVREVGFKIKSVITFTDSALVPDMLEYYTNIPEALWKTKWEFWEEWNKASCEDYTTPDSDSESNEEIKSEDTDPAN